MNFRDLEYVIAVGRHLSFSKAAETCNVSQPSLSTQVKKLEGELGAEIFIRGKRQIHLSAFGETFVAKAKEILEIRDAIRRSAQRNKNPLEGKIKLGAILTVAPYLFPEIVRTISRMAPKIRLSLKEAKTDELLRGILNGRIDAALISLPTDDSVFQSQSLFTEAFYLAVPAGHKLARKKVISDSDLKGLGLLLLEEGHCFRDQALEVCRSTAAQEHDAFRATSLETIRHFVSIGEGVTLMPDMARQAHDGVSYIPMKNDRFRREIGLVWRRSGGKRPQIEKLLSLMQGIYG